MAWFGAIRRKKRLERSAERFKCAISGRLELCDSGVVFERSSRIFDRGWTLTLEPHALYVQTPFVAQNYLPNYDTGLNSFNFSSIFSMTTRHF